MNFYNTCFYLIKQDETGTFTIKLQVTKKNNESDLFN